MIKINSTIFSLFLNFILVMQLFSQSSKRTAAVWEFRNSGGIDNNEITTLTNRFRNNLVNTNFYKVLEREKMETILKEQDFIMSDNCNSSECAVEVGKLLGVERMIAGDIGIIGQYYTIDIRIINVTTGEIIKSESQNYEGGTEGLLGIIESMAFTLVGKNAPNNSRVKYSKKEKETKVSGKTISDDSGDEIKVGKVLRKYGDLEINCEFDGVLYIDSKKVGDVSEGSIIPIEKLKTGQHTIQIKTVDGREYFEEIIIEYNKKSIITAKINKIIGVYKDNYFDSRDGKKYKTVKIGNQVWLAENFNYDAGEGCSCYNNAKYCDEYGKLYTIEAASRAVPIGWHIPSRNEFEQLISYLGGQKNAYSALLVNSSTNFNAHLSGWLRTDGLYGFFGKEAAFWSSSSVNDGYWYMSIHADYEKAFVISTNKNYAFSLRLIKD